MVIERIVAPAIEEVARVVAAAAGELRGPEGEIASKMLSRESLGSALKALADGSPTSFAAGSDLSDSVGALADFGRFGLTSEKSSGMVASRLSSAEPDHLERFTETTVQGQYASSSNSFEMTEPYAAMSLKKFDYKGGASPAIINRAFDTTDDLALSTWHNEQS